MNREFNLILKGLLLHCFVVLSYSGILKDEFTGSLVCNAYYVIHESVILISIVE